MFLTAPGTRYSHYTKHKTPPLTDGLRPRTREPQLPSRAQGAVVLTAEPAAVVLTAETSAGVEGARLPLMVRTAGALPAAEASAVVVLTAETSAGVEGARLPLVVRAAGEKSKGSPALH